MVNPKTVSRLSEFVGGIAGDIAGGRADALLSIPLWHGSKSFGSLDMLMKPFKAIEEADNNELTPVTPVGFRNIFDSFINTMLVLAPIIGRELVDELIGEMLQEGISNSIQTSLGGALQTILNTKRGGFPGFEGIIEDTTKYATIYDNKLIGLVNAGVGYNLQATSVVMANAINDYISDNLRRYINELIGMITYCNNYTFGILTNQLVALNVVISRYVTLPIEVAMFHSELVRRVCEEHLARINELEDSLEMIYKYYTEGIVTDQQFILTEMAKVEAELNATMDLFTEYYNAVDGKYMETIKLITGYGTGATPIDNVITQILNTIRSIVSKMVNVINSANDSDVAYEVANECVDNIDDILRKVYAHRDVTRYKNIRYTITQQ